MRDQPVQVLLDGVWVTRRLVAWGRGVDGWLGLVEVDPGASFGRTAWVPAERLRPVPDARKPPDPAEVAEPGGS